MPPKILYFDNETEPTRHDVAVPRCALTCVAIGDGDVMARSPGAETTRRLQTDIDTGGILVGHNIAFDIATSGLTVTDYSRVYDTSIRGVLIGAASGMHSDASHSLKDLARPYGYNLAKGAKTTLSFGDVYGPDDCTPEQMQYAVLDVMATRSVFQGQGGLTRVSPDEQRQTEMAWRVWKMARLGVRVDLPRVYDMQEVAREKTDALRQQLIAGQIIRPKGPKKDPWRDSSVDTKFVQILLRDSGATRVSDSGSKLAADEDALRGSGVPILGVLADYLKAQKWQGLVDGFNTGEGDIIRAWWKPLVASGRISSGHPNLTQVPRAGGLRECIIPREGNALVAVDFAALEFRVWAATCETLLGWSRAAQILREGIDPHIFVAVEILGSEWDYKRVEQECKNAKKWLDVHGALDTAPVPMQQAHWARQAAKAVNYGKIGGMGVDRLAEQIGCTREKAGDIIAAWERAFPESVKYARWLKSCSVGGGQLRVVLPWSKRERQAFYTEAANVMIQGGGADVAKEALRIVQDAGGPVVMLGHDELLLDVPVSEAKDWGEFVARACQQAGELVYPGVDWRQKYEVFSRWPSKA